MSLATRTLKVEPFTPNLPQADLDKLERVLKQSQDLLPVETYASSTQAQNDGKNYGVTTEWMRKALDYWSDGFDWSEHQEHLNSVNHFMTTIDDAECGSFKVHYIAHISDDTNAIPLLLLHGWPGSAHEFTSAILSLSKPSSSSSSSFHIICPNQPGYGFSSSPPRDSSFGMHDVARLMNTLMLGLGFNEYVVQGGDIGSVIGRIMATRYDQVKALNVNYLPLFPPNGQTFTTQGWDQDLTPREKENAYKAQTFATVGRGYGVMHGTRPATIGIVVQSNPIALLAWLGEKFLEWMDEEPSLDTVLGVVTMWWCLGTFPKAIYAYAELTSGVGAWHRDPKLFVHKPFGFSSFAKEIASAPASWARQTGNLQFYRYHERGGHFAAMERPEDFAQDMKDCFSEFWKLLRK